MAVSALVPSARRRRASAQSKRGHWSEEPEEDTGRPEVSVVFAKDPGSTDYI